MDPNTATPAEPDATLPVDAAAEVNPDLLAAVQAAVTEAPAEPDPTPAADPVVDPAADPVDPAADPAVPAVDPAAAPAADPAAPVAPAADPAAAPAAKRPSDEFGELDKDVPAKTRERFDTLKTKFDEVATERDAFRDQATQWVDTVRSTGADPEQFGMTLSFLKDINSGTPEGLERAYTAVMGQAELLAKMLGRPFNGGATAFDPLALPEHADLKAEVEAGDLTEPRAQEIIAQRQRARLTQVHQEQAQAVTSQQTVQQQGLNDLQALGAELRTRDPHFAAKFKAIEGAVSRVVAKLPPSEWRGAVLDLYNAIPAPAAAPAAPRAGNVPDTLRPTAVPGAGGTVAKEPGSALEAVKLALGQTS